MELLVYTAIGLVVAYILWKAFNAATTCFMVLFALIIAMFMQPQNRSSFLQTVLRKD
jgi:hypothetical protein